jgi:CSLREA domain-containing protein
MAGRFLSASPTRLLAFGAFLLAALAGCQDYELPTAWGPDAPTLTQVASAPVVNSLNDPGDGTCDDAECTLREAIAFASSGATITFSVTGTITLLGGELLLNKNLTVAGPEGSTVTVSGNNASRVFFVGAGVTAELRNLTITGGNSVGARMTYPFSGEDGHGGGILNNGGALTIRNSTIAGNSAQETRAGAGLFNAIGVVLVENSTISGNSGGWYGAGIYNYGSDWAESLTIMNSTISGNATGSWGRGGGVYHYSGVMRIHYSTIASNGTGGGITTRDSHADGRVQAHALGSIIAANSGSDLAGTYGGESAVPYYSSGYNMIGTASSAITAVFDATGDQTGVTSPGLGTLASNGGPTMTQALLTGSPAIDAGPASGCPATDQRGVSRPQGSACDIGAYEKEASGSLLTPTFTFDLSELPARTYGGDAFSVSSYATRNSDGGITFAIGSGSVGCTVTASGMVTITGAAVDPDHCILEATLASDGTYAGAGPISQSFNIAKAAGYVSISNLPGSGVVGAGFTPTYTKAGDGAASTVSNSTGICTVTEGEVAFVAAGTCLLRASVAEGTNHLAATGNEQSFAVSLTTPTFTFDLSTLLAKTYGDASFGVAGAPYVTTNSTGTVTFALGTGSVGCSVTAAGEVTITGAATGTNYCILKASLAAAAPYDAAGPISQQFNIAKATTSVSIANMPTSPVVGDNFTPTYTTASDGTTSTASSTPTVCTVTGGVVNLIAEGECTLVASVTEGSNHLQATGDPQQVTVGATASPAPVLSVTVSGQGRVTSSPAGIDCTHTGGTCSASFARNTNVTLTATADPDWTFVGWSGEASGTGSSSTVRMNKDRNVVATFAEPISPPGGFSSSCTYTIHPRNDQRRVTVSWAGAVPGVTMIVIESDGVRVERQQNPSTSGSWSTNVKSGGPAYELRGGTSRTDVGTVLVAPGTACALEVES